MDVALPREARALGRPGLDAALRRGTRPRPAKAQGDPGRRSDSSGPCRPRSSRAWRDTNRPIQVKRSQSPGQNREARRPNSSYARRQRHPRLGRFCRSPQAASHPSLASRHWHTIRMPSYSSRHRALRSTLRGESFETTWQAIVCARPSSTIVCY